MDILVAGIIQESDDTLTHELRVYRNEGGGSYLPMTLPVPTPNWLDFHGGSWADYNSDGVIDLLLTGSFIGEQEIEGRSEIYVNSGGTFTPVGANLSAPIESIGRGGTFTWLDLDGDGDLDYLVAGAYFVPGGNGLVEAQIHLFRNDAPAANRSPTAPLALSAIDLGIGTVLLSWAPAADDSTSGAALTYEMEIFVQPAPGELPREATYNPATQLHTAFWNTTAVPDGAYDVGAFVLDSDGNWGASRRVRVTVNNVP